MVVFRSFRKQLRQVKIRDGDSFPRKHEEEVFAHAHTFDNIIGNAKAEVTISNNTRTRFISLAKYIILSCSLREKYLKVRSDESRLSREKKKQEDRLLYISIVVCFLEVRMKCPH